MIKNRIEPEISSREMVKTKKKGRKGHQRNLLMAQAICSPQLFYEKSRLGNTNRMFP